jgi:glycosyltransferase involved in cell wall biosynthesis
VLGDIPSLRELWGDTALYVAPDDVAAFSDALLRLIGDVKLRGALAHAARTRALRYSPERMAREYLEAYANIMARGTLASRAGAPAVTESSACAS